MRRSSRLRLAIGVGAVALAGIAALAAPGSTPAQGPDSGRVPVNVMVVQTSNQKGEVDPRAQDLHEKLKKQLRYKSMRVIQEQRVDLEMNQVGTVELPDGRKVRMRPLHKGAKGVLMGRRRPGRGEARCPGPEPPQGGDRRRRVPERKPRGFDRARLRVSPLGAPRAGLSGRFGGGSKKKLRFFRHRSGGRTTSLSDS
jgi:hypothetical protein